VPAAGNKRLSSHHLTQRSRRAKVRRHCPQKDLLFAPPRLCIFALNGDELCFASQR
jgi:hypothetical protein